MRAPNASSISSGTSLFVPAIATLKRLDAGTVNVFTTGRRLPPIGPYRCRRHPPASLQPSAALGRRVSALAGLASAFGAGAGVRRASRTFLAASTATTLTRVGEAAQVGAARAEIAEDRVQ